MAEVILKQFRDFKKDLSRRTDEYQSVNMAVKIATRMPFEYSEGGKGTRHAHFEHTIHIPLEKPTPTCMSGRSTPISGRRTPGSLKIHGHMIEATFAIHQRPGDRSDNSTPRQARLRNECPITGATTPVQRPESGLHGHRQPLLRKQLGLSKLGLDGLTRKGLVRDVIRPLSASVLERKRRRREILKSAKRRQHITKPGDQNDQSKEE